MRVEATWRSGDGEDGEDGEGLDSDRAEVLSDTFYGDRLQTARGNQLYLSRN